MALPKIVANNRPKAPHLTITTKTTARMTANIPLAIVTKAKFLASLFKRYSVSFSEYKLVKGMAKIVKNAYGEEGISLFLLINT